MPNRVNARRSVKRRHALNRIQQRRRILFLSLIAVSTLLCSKFLIVKNGLHVLRVRCCRPFREVYTNYSDSGFRRAYRMPRNSFTQLVSFIAYEFRRNTAIGALRGGALSPEVRVGITLMLMVGASYLDILYPYGVKNCCIRRVFGNNNFLLRIFHFRIICTLFLTSTNQLD